MKAAKTPKNLKEMPYSTQKMLFKKKRKNYYTSKDKCLKFTNFFRMPKIQTDQMRNKELKMKLRQLQEKISKASLPVSADLNNDFKSILKTDQRKNYPSWG